jgi:DNA-binding response OmpR family regulator/predicted ATPase
MNSPALDLATGQLDLEQGVFTPRSGPPVRLTAQERSLLSFLARRAMHDVSREDLLREVLGYADGVASRAVDDTVKRLRAKIEAIPSRPFHLVGVRGTGYRFVPLDAATPVSVRSAYELGLRVVDLDRLVVRHDGTETPLSSTEGRFLEALARREGRPVSPEELLREVWGVRDRGQRRLVDKLVYRLRIKIEDDPSCPNHLVTVRGRGLALASAQPILSVPPAERRTYRRMSGPPFAVHGRTSAAEVLHSAVSTPGILTLHGPAGVGKSTLARQALSEVDEDVAWLDLESCSTDGDVLEAAARAIGVDPESESTAPRLVAAIGAGPRIWLVEHPEPCLTAAVRLMELARGARPDLTMVVTSRRSLGARGERIQPVEPLTLDAALTMLSERSAAQGVPIDLADARASWLVERIDRLPLAIDLAVPRLRWMGLDGLLNRIERSLDVLQREGTGGVRSQSLRASLAWTWDALSDAERTLLIDLTAFYGSFTLDAAEFALASRHGPGLLEGLQRLTDFSLLRREGSRLALYHGVGELARELAPEACREARSSVWPALGTWFASRFIPRSFWDEPSPDQTATLLADLDGAMAWLDQSAESADRTATLRWVLPILHRTGQNGRLRPWWQRLVRERAWSDPGIAVRVLLALPKMIEAGARNGQYQALANQWTSVPALWIAARAEGLCDAADAGHSNLAGLRAELLTNLPPDLPWECESLVRLGSGWSAFRLGDLDHAWSELQEGLALARLAGLPWLEARIAYNLAGVCHAEGRLTEAESFLHLARSRLAAVPRAALDDHIRDLLGLVWLDQGRWEQARAVHELLLVRYRESGDLEFAAQQANRLGTLDGVRGDPAAAARWFEIARAGFEAAGSQAWSAGSLFNLGECAWHLGRPAEARAHYLSALAIYERLGRRVHQGVVLASLARVAAADGDAEAVSLYERAIELLDHGRARRQAAVTRARLASQIAQADPARSQTLAAQAVHELEKLGPSTEWVEALVTWLEVGTNDRQSAAWLARRKRALELARTLGMSQDRELERRLAGLAG